MKYIKKEILQICKAFNLGSFINMMKIKENNGFVETEFLTNKGIYTHYYRIK